MTSHNSDTAARPEAPLSMDRPVRLMRQMSHDMQVPLAAIVATSGLFAEGGYGELTPKQRRAIDRISRNGDRLVAILDDLMAYVKAQAGELMLTPQTFEPRALVNSIVEKITPAITEKGLALEVNFDDSVPQFCTADDGAISRILLALLWNAISFTEQGSIVIKAQRRGKTRLVLSVKDSGTGIPSEDVPHIFDPFWRGNERPQAPTTATSGCGLGLTMAQAVAKALKGKLTLQNTSSGGSSFVLSVPVNP